jgi:hypothetical protein
MDSIDMLHSAHFHGWSNGVECTIVACFAKGMSPGHTFTAPDEMAGKRSDRWAWKYANAAKLLGCARGSARAARHRG